MSEPGNRAVQHVGDLMPGVQQYTCYGVYPQDAYQPDHPANPLSTPVTATVTHSASEPLNWIFRTVACLHIDSSSGICEPQGLSLTTGSRRCRLLGAVQQVGEIHRSQ